MSTITTSSSDNTLPAVTSSTTTQPVITNLHVTTNSITALAMCSSQEIMPSLPMTTMVYNTNMGPPPLIPAASQQTHSLTSPLRPITSNLFAPQNLYELPMNIQSQINATSAVYAPRNVYMGVYFYSFL